MPYLTEDFKQEIEKAGELGILADYLASLPEDKFPGALNYVISQLIKKHLHTRGVTYFHLNNVVGSLECAKQEIIRRIVNPYEEQKCKDNGDVF